jgi:hypothetical protein
VEILYASSWDRKRLYEAIREEEVKKDKPELQIGKRI